ncbi:kinesin, putative, partial [Leishmania panamensis]
LAETEETLQETSAKLADTEDTLQETSAKLAETEDTLQETSAKLAETEETLSLEVISVKEQLRAAQVLSEQQCVYLDHVMAYVGASYSVTLDGLTELQWMAVEDMVMQTSSVVRRVSQAAHDEVERMKEMCNIADDNYKMTAERFDILRRILGKIDQDVKEASVEIDGQERRQSGSSRATPHRLGDVSNRENSMERKSCPMSRLSSMQL